jgi:hypothetical protein
LNNLIKQFIMFDFECSTFFNSVYLLSQANNQEEQNTHWNALNYLATPQSALDKIEAAYKFFYRKLKWIDSAADLESFQGCFVAEKVLSVLETYQLFGYAGQLIHRTVLSERYLDVQMRWCSTKKQFNEVCDLINSSWTTAFDQMSFQRLLHRRVYSETALEEIEVGKIKQIFCRFRAAHSCSNPDLEIVIDGTSYKFHSQLFLREPSFFYSLFKLDMSEGMSQLAFFNAEDWGVSTEALGALVEYLGLGQTIPNHLVVESWILAHKFSLRSVEEDLLRYILFFAPVEIPAHALVIAIEFDFVDFQRKGTRQLFSYASESENQCIHLQELLRSWQNTLEGDSHMQANKINRFLSALEFLVERPLEITEQNTVILNDGEWDLQDLKPIHRLMSQLGLAHIHLNLNGNLDTLSRGMDWYSFDSVFFRRSSVLKELTVFSHTDFEKAMLSIFKYLEDPSCGLKKFSLQPLSHLPLAARAFTALRNNVSLTHVHLEQVDFYDDEDQMISWRSLQERKRPIISFEELMNYLFESRLIEARFWNCNFTADYLYEPNWADYNDNFSLEYLDLSYTKILANEQFIETEPFASGISKLKSLRTLSFNPTLLHLDLIGFLSRVELPFIECIKIDVAGQPGVIWQEIKDSFLGFPNLNRVEINGEVFVFQDEVIEEQNFI